STSIPCMLMKYWSISNVQHLWADSEAAPVFPDGLRHHAPRRTTACSRRLPASAALPLPGAAERQRSAPKERIERRWCLMRWLVSQQGLILLHMPNEVYLTPA